MPYIEEEYRKEYGKKWREAHSDYHKQYSKKYYEEKKDAIKAKACGMTEEEIRQEREEKEKKKALKAAKREFQKKMKEFKLEVTETNNCVIISNEHRTKDLIPEEYRDEYDKHELGLKRWLERQITNKMIFVSEISRQHILASRELYLTANYEYLVSLPNEIWTALKDWDFMEY